jgi:hypothetical protein
VIDDAGNINIGYLGTKPPIAAIGGVKRDLDYDKLDDEHRKLLQVVCYSTVFLCLLLVID